MSIKIPKENLLFFENENIDIKEYYRQQNKINKVNKKNDDNEKESKEPEVESSDEQNNSPQNSPSSLEEFNDLENDVNENENENEETVSKKSDEFPKKDFDIFDESKCIIIPTQNDDSDDEKSKKEERINIIDNSTSPTEPIQNQINVIKRNDIERKRTNNCLRKNNRTQNRKSSLSAKKCIRERSRSKK